MKNYSILFTALFASMMLLSLSSCGYKPSSKYARNVVGERVSTSVIISAQDPENTVIIKDAVDSAIIEIFHTSLTKKKNSDTHLTFSITEPTYTPIQYNQDGFVIAYRATITLKVKRETKDTIKQYAAKGTYDFSVVPNAVITDQERFDAIRFSAQKAISSFIAQVSAEGSRVK
ncbi:LPS assembly lipoprotein LptE [Sulfurimonas sp.]